MNRLLLVGEVPGLRQALEKTLLPPAAPSSAEVESCEGNVEAIRLLRSRAFDVIVTHPWTSMADALPIVRELQEARPGIRIIVLAPHMTPAQVVEAVRAHVFACFAAPFDVDEIVAMVQRALAEPHWQDGIEVTSGLPHWISLRVSCRLLTAERLMRFMTEHRSDVPEEDRDLLMTAFREMLMNAMEHGAGFDAEQVIEVSAARTHRAIVYHFRDPGPGFDRTSMPASLPCTPEELITHLEERQKYGKRPGGFGMLLVKQIVDEVVFNERGNEVLLIKYLDQS